MLMYIIFDSAIKFIEWVGRYDMHSTLFIANGCVANRHNRFSNVASAGMRWSDRHNRLTIIPHRRLAIHDKKRTLHAVQLRIPG